MKILGNLMLLLFLITGTLSATTAYHVPLRLADDYFKNEKGGDLTLKLHAGVVLLKDKTALTEKQRDHKQLWRLESAFLPTIAGLSGRELFVGLLSQSEEKNESLVHRAMSISRISSEQLINAKIEWIGKDEIDGLLLVKYDMPVPLAQKKDKLTTDLVKELRRQANFDDPRVRRDYVLVQEFSIWSWPYNSIFRWPYNWAFLLSLIGLLAGGLMVRYSQKKQIKAGAIGAAAEGPDAALEGLQQTLGELRGEIASLDESAALQLIIAKLDEAQQSHMSAFIDARPQLIARFGMGGYADLMDSYAACERQVNRAWSAAADEVYEEAVDCLDNAAELLSDTMKKMKEHQ